MIDHKITWENQVQHIVKKLCIAKGISLYTIPLTVLRSVFYSSLSTITIWNNLLGKCFYKIWWL